MVFISRDLFFTNLYFDLDSRREGIAHCHWKSFSYWMLNVADYFSRQYSQNDQMLFAVVFPQTIKMAPSIISHTRVSYGYIFTAWKVSVFGVSLVRMWKNAGKMHTKIQFCEYIRETTFVWWIYGNLQLFINFQKSLTLTSHNDFDVLNQNIL